MTPAFAKASAGQPAGKPADRPLRIGVDARELLGDATGVGRYLGELLRRWASRPDASARRFLLYAPESLPLALPPGATELRITGRGRGTWWEQTYLRSAIHGDRPDVFFAPAYTAPLGTEVPLAVTIHDISFVAHPEWFRAGEGARRRWLTRRAAHKASIIFTDSEFSRREIESYLRVDPSRLRVIPPGVTPRASSSANKRARSASALRRVHLQPPAHSRFDCRLRSGDARYAAGAFGDRWRRSDLAKTGSSGRRPSARRCGANRVHALRV